MSQKKCPQIKAFLVEEKSFKALSSSEPCGHHDRQSCPFLCDALYEAVLCTCVGGMEILIDLAQLKISRN